MGNSNTKVKKCDWSRLTSNLDKGNMIFKYTILFTLFFLLCSCEDRTFYPHGLDIIKHHESYKEENKICQNEHILIEPLESGIALNVYSSCMVSTNFFIKESLDLIEKNKNIRIHISFFSCGKEECLSQSSFFSSPKPYLTIYFNK